MLGEGSTGRCLDSRDKGRNRSKARRLPAEARACRAGGRVLGEGCYGKTNGVDESGNRSKVAACLLKLEGECQVTSVRLCILCSEVV